MEKLHNNGISLIEEQRIMIRKIQRIVITGATGVLGMALLHSCIEKKIYVLVITHKDSARNANIPKSEYIQLVYADISEYDYIDTTKLAVKGFHDFDAFIHLAWQGTVGDSRNDMDIQTRNIQNTLSAVRLAGRLGCKLFIGAGSQAEYGRVEGYLNSDVPVFPENGYGMAKLCAGQMSRIVCEQLGMEHIWLRVLSIYGPYDGENSMVTSAIRGFLNDKEISFTAGEQKWDYLYSEDAADIILRLLKKGYNGKTYCIGSGKYRMIKDYIKDIYLAVHGEEVSEEQIGIGKVPYSPKQVMFLCADISELVADIGEIHFTPFTEGIRRTVSWYKNK